jgi:transposase
MKANFTSSEIELMSSLYRDKKLSCREIARRLDCGHSQVYKALKESGIELRSSVRIKLPAPQRFQSLVERGKPNDCWNWKGGKHFTKENGQKVEPYRFAWELENGDIPKGKPIRRDCGNNLCVNLITWLSVTI